MSTRSDQPESRDQVIARLAAEALRPQPSASQACPDAEWLAAYADQGLSESERLQAEEHFVGCERCQKILAALGASLEAPAGEAAAVPESVRAPVGPRPASVPRRWLWWLSPAFGAAAAALLWMALRPTAPQPVQTAADYSRIAEQETRAPSAPALTRTVPESVTVPTERRDAQALDRLSKTESADKEAKEAKATTDEQSVGQFAASRADSISAAALPVQALRSEVQTAGAPQTAVAQATTQPAPQPLAANPAAAVNEQVPLRGRAVAAPGAAPQSLSDGSVRQVVLYTFSSPDGSVVWRLGAAGSIEKSGDRGQTWQRQSSGVTEDLIAGSAASNSVAWAVGRGRVILLTTDGQAWQRIAPPTGMTGEWTAVAARDAMSATVVASDLRRFSSEDGGRTWTQQQ